MVLASILGRRTAAISSATPSPSPSRSASPRPAPAEPSLVLKIYVLKAKDLAALDRGGTSDPYTVVVLDDFKATTQAIQKTLNPEWNAVFNVALYPAESEYIIEGTLWDKDRFSKDYLGSFDISLIEKFSQSDVTVVDSNENEPQWYPLYSARARKTYIKGHVYIKLALVCPLDPGATNEELLRKWKTMVSDDSDPTTPLLPLSDSENAFDNSVSSLESSDEDGETPTDSTYLDVPEKTSRRRRLRLRRQRSHKPYQVGSLADVVGVVFFEIVKVTDLPPERNVMRTGFDMDPFVVVSFGKNVVRTGVQRHSLDPVYNEKVLFPILRHEQGYTFNLTVIDHDALSSNDFVAKGSLSVQEILKFGPKPDPDTGLYNLPLPQTPPGSTESSRQQSRSRGSRSSSHVPSRPQTPVPSSDRLEKLSEAMKNTGIATNESMDQFMTTFNIPLVLKHRARWEEKHSPEIQIRAKYVPYSALRQQFWKYLLVLYDGDERNMISRFEIDGLLEYLGSTLHSSTVDSFFSRFGKSIDEDLTFDEAIVCLEDQLHRDRGRRSKVIEHVIPMGAASTEDGSLAHATESKSNADLTRALQEDRHLIADRSGPSFDTVTDDNYSRLESELRTLKSGEEMSPEKTPTTTTDGSGTNRSNESLEDGTATPIESYFQEIEERTEEHVITMRECPVCHQPRLDRRSEVDIITHLAMCASQDWKQVDLLNMNAYVTADQAKRKWVGNVTSKLGYGGYRLGANSANILVQDRLTGYISEERMSMYVRLGIRLLYKGLKSREMERKRIRQLLASLSVKQGKKYDDIRSVKDIKPFVEFHQLDLSEVLEPLDYFKTFNQFFYRKLKPGSRPCAAPDQPKIATSPADCRTVVFESIDRATQIWVKGREFSLERLFGGAYPDEVKKFVGGAMGIFRLAPQDYHRFHIPVDGVLGCPKLIEGAYYTVNPMAIRSDLDVFGENVRVLVPIDSDEFGRVMIVCIGAMMVGSTVITAKEGQRVSRTEELGYFQFGGSTLLLFFQPGTLDFDSDLVSNSKDSLETLIRVGMSIGHTPDEDEQLQEHGKVEELSEKEKAEAARRIEGSFAPKVDDF
ncbi:phosphatidylserine decarboxylase-domain-containing protein [Lipomyces chichibuensis]|uniref:phosphatidylserine decarboxylase-domain-containing protein n=1 Tax=Lipomyces chichibuensis TaxID=1546026 RepID=UPI00334311A4